MRNARTIIGRTAGVALELIEASRGSRATMLSSALDVIEPYAERRRKPAAPRAV